MMWTEGREKTSQDTAYKSIAVLTGIFGAIKILKERRQMRIHMTMQPVDKSRDPPGDRNG